MLGGNPVWKTLTYPGPPPRPGVQPPRAPDRSEDLSTLKGGCRGPQDQRAGLPNTFISLVDSLLFMSGVEELQLDTAKDWE